MSISKLYISLFKDPEWPVEAVPVFTKKDLSTAIKADTSLICKTTIYDIDILDSARGQNLETDRGLLQSKNDNNSRHSSKNNL